jgi:hypothetical protein
LYRYFHGACGLAPWGGKAIAHQGIESLGSEDKAAVVFTRDNRHALRTSHMIVRGCVEPSSGSTDHKSTQTAGSVHATLVFPDFAQDPPPTPALSATCGSQWYREKSWGGFRLSGDLRFDVPRQHLVDQRLITDASSSRFPPELLQHGSIHPDRNQLACLRAEGGTPDPPHRL